MTGGYMGKILFVNLSTGEINEETPDEQLYRDFIGGYGVGARILYSRQKAGADPLGVDNILGFVTGLLTGTPAITGARYTIVAKSPLTGTWGDANSGGDFGPYLKFSGYDAVFFTGTSQKPVYLLIDHGKAELRDAGRLWGRDAFETEDIIMSQLGKDTHVACIGPSGEKLSLISSIMNNKGRAAGRSGLGAVMGSKKLKAVAVKGSMEVPLADGEQVREVRRKHLYELMHPRKKPRTPLEDFRKYGTSGSTHEAVEDGDAPVKNWGGIGVIDFPNAIAISRDNVFKYKAGGYACWRCPIGCGGTMKEGTGKYVYAAGAHKPEYETLNAFGAMCLNDNIKSIIKVNDICNRYGLDTISAGCAIAFAIECFENGLISNKGTEGIELTWGNHEAIVAMTEKLAKREGFGSILADGVRAAAGKIGKGTEQYAIHIEGQEMAMHDPKLSNEWILAYKMDATPGRHTQGWSASIRPGMEKPPEEKVGERHKMGSNLMHVVNAAGLCFFGFMRQNAPFVPEMLSAVTGWPISMDDVLLAGERIANIRQAFNVREGIISPIEREVHGRVLGKPPQKEGPLAGVTIDVESMEKQYFEAADWDPATGKPSREKLVQLGLDDVGQELWPQ
jgi:aldehyde:ferredoxin oxidoreductase